MGMIPFSKNDNLLPKILSTKSDAWTRRADHAYWTFSVNFNQTKYKIFQHDSRDISRRKGVVVVMEAVVGVVMVMVMVM